MAATLALLTGFQESSQTIQANDNYNCDENCRELEPGEDTEGNPLYEGFTENTVVKNCEKSDSSVRIRVCLDSEGQWFWERLDPGETIRVGDLYFIVHAYNYTPGDACVQAWQHSDW